MATCCSSGKARVYFNIPIEGVLKYKLKGEKAWKTILANEPLISSCVIKNSAITNYLVAGNVYVSFGNSSYNQSFSKIILGPILNFISTGDGTTQGTSLLATTENGVISIYATTSYYLLTATYQYTVTRVDNQPDKKQFTVTGTETGTKYVDIEVDECPAVQTIPCKFDPAKEQYIDVEMSTSPNVESCIDVVEADPNPITGGLGVHIILIKIVRDHKGGPRPPIWSSRGYFYSPKGCPAPKVRVECCTTPDCQNNKKCPKGTTCEIVCNGFKCCYRNNKLIRSIKL